MAMVGRKWSRGVDLELLLGRAAWRLPTDIRDRQLTLAPTDRRIANIIVDTINHGPR